MKDRECTDRASQIRVVMSGTVERGWNVEGLSVEGQAGLVVSEGGRIGMSCQMRRGGLVGYWKG